MVHGQTAVGAIPRDLSVSGWRQAKGDSPTIDLPAEYGPPADL
jgi:hypothetical protein